MPLQLYAPGRRKDNRYWVIRGRPYPGAERIEIVARTADGQKIADPRARDLAEAALRRALKAALDERPAAVGGDRVTFKRAADLYGAANPGERESTKRYLAAIAGERAPTWFGKLLVKDIRQAHVDQRARELYPLERYTNDTRERNVYTPVIATLRYAALNEWCPLRKIARPDIVPLNKRPPRAAAPHAALRILKALDDEPDKYLLVLWLSKHGTRITDALRNVRWTSDDDEQLIDLERLTYRHRVSKSASWHTFALDEEVAELLAQVPEVERKGRVFKRWSNRASVYNWLTPIAKRLGLTWTPHMARHAVGKHFGNNAGIRGVMDRLGQHSVRAAERYTSADLEVQRQVQGAMGRLTGPKVSSGGRVGGKSA